MKKLLTLLLTIIMTICLINLNNSYIKADETNKEYTYVYHIDGGGNECWEFEGQDMPQSYNKGDVITFKYVSGEGYPKVQLPYGVKLSVPKDEAPYLIKYTAEHNGITINSSSNPIVIGDTKLIQHEGLRYNSADTWLTCENKPVSNPSLSDMGIEKVSSGVYKLTKELTIINKSDKNVKTLDVNADLTLNLDEDIILANIASGLETVQCTQGKNFIINGDNHLLTIEECYAKSTGKPNPGKSITAGLTNTHITLNDLNLIANRSGTQVSCEFDTLTLNNSTIRIINKSGAALKINNTQSRTDLANNYDILGKAEVTDTELKDATPNGSGAYQVDDGTGNMVNAKYIFIAPKMSPTQEQGEMPYDVTNGFTGLVTQGSASPLTAHIAGAVKGVDTVTVTEGGTPLTSNDYEIQDGSIKVVFKPSYLNNLSPGTHTLTINIRNTNFIVTINVEGSAPSPSEPSKKDESCEKVIGPTWHWNNTKGICEDYGVVGTYTR